MNEATIALFIALLSSPIWIPLYENARNRVWAKLTFHGWQAVFLNTPEYISTYFGHIKSIGKNEITLVDIYYLTEDETTPGNLNKIKNPQLTKLGKAQLHYPEDKMVINRQHIVFMENMTDEAPVVQAIHEYRREK